MAPYSFPLLSSYSLISFNGQQQQLFAQTDNELVGYRRFMDLICHLKIQRLNESFWSLETDELFQDKKKDKRIPKKTAKQQDYCIGEWYVLLFLTLP
jgi:hypothetical protein